MEENQHEITRYCRIGKAGMHASTGFSLSNTFGSLDEFLLNAYDVLGMDYPKYYKADRLSKLGLLAAEVILTGHDYRKKYSPESIAVILSNASASLDTDLRYHESTKSIASPALFVYTLPNIVAGEICIRHGIKGENVFFVSPQFDATLMMENVQMAMQVPGTEACLAGWVEVLKDDFDVFLYLVENQKPGEYPLHSGEELERLYRMDVWNS